MIHTSSVTWKQLPAHWTIEDAIGRIADACVGPEVKFKVIKPLEGAVQENCRTDLR